MLIDESKIAVDSSFSFLNLRKQHTNLKLKLLFKIETQNHSHWAKSLHKHFLQPTNSDRTDLTATYQVQVATTHYRDRPGSDHPLYGYTSQQQIHKLGKTAYETNT